MLAGQVAEAGGEAAEGDRPDLTGVDRDDLVGSQPGAVGDLGQVGAGVVDRDGHGLLLVGGREVHSRQVEQVLPLLGAERAVQPEQQGPRARHDLGDLAKCRATAGRSRWVSARSAHSSRTAPAP